MPAGSKVKLILDSGAYSAWRLGKQIDREAYCDYLLENEDWIYSYINLDVINPKDSEAAAAESFKNLVYMRKRGLNPMPVYHVGEDISWLHRILDLGCDYIAIGALSMRATDRADDFYAYVWSHLVDGKGQPVVKVHGLGEGRLKQLLRFPWASADSTSWVYTAHRTGRLTLSNGSSISMRNDGKGSKGAPDIGSLDSVGEAVLSQIMAKHGIAREALAVKGREAWVIRGYLMVLYNMEIERLVRQAQPIMYKTIGFFSEANKQSAIVTPEFNLHLVFQDFNGTWMLPVYGSHYSLLTSFFYVKQQKAPSFDFRTFVNNALEYSANFDKAQHVWQILKRYVKC